MVTFWASAGMVICGSMGSPSEVTSVAVAVQVEGPGARVGQLARGLPHLEEAAPLDDQVEGIAGGLEVAL